MADLLDRFKARIKDHLGSFPHATTCRRFKVIDRGKPMSYHYETAPVREWLKGLREMLEE